MPDIVPVFQGLPESEDIGRKAAYIEQYIVNFAATWDVAHFDFNQGVVTVPCDLKLALELAEKSWSNIGSML